MNCLSNTFDPMGICGFSTVGATGIRIFDSYVIGVHGLISYKVVSLIRASVV
jgi:hypothetical protein